jgi:replicative DNA helicase
MEDYPVFTRESYTRTTRTNDATPPPTLRFSDLLDAWQADAEAAHEAFATGKARGPQTGFEQFDQAIGGALSAGLHFINGGPGVGKTAFALQVGGACGCPALYVTCEMAPLELFRRTTARVTRTFLGRLKSGELRPDESLALARQAAAEVPALVIIDATEGYAAPAWLLACGEAMKGDAAHLLVVVDSVHSWAEAAPGSAASEYDALNTGLAALRTLSHQLDCPVLGLAERNRASMKRGGLSASAGTRKFEFGAETMIELDRDDDVQPDPNGETLVTLRLSKNRSGAPGAEIEMLFHGALQRWRQA